MPEGSVVEVNPNHSIHRYFADDPQIAYKEILEKDQYVASGYFIRPFLNSIQAPQEYSNKKRKQIESLFRDKGLQALQEHPLLLCALPLSSKYPLDAIEPNVEYRVVILDGHHRVRYLPRELAQKPLFSICFSLSQGAQLYREGPTNWPLRNKSDEEVLNALHTYADTAELELTKVMPHFSTPANVTFTFDKSGLIIPKAVKKSL